MKYYYISIALILLFSCEQKEKVVLRHQNGKPKEVHVYNDKTDNVDYNLKQYYENGVVKFIAPVKNNLFISYKKSFNQNGVIKQSCILKSTTEMDYCCPDGLYTTYDSNGVVFRSKNLVNNKVNGDDILYFPNGKIKSKFTAIDDKKNGAIRQYFENGSPRVIGNFVNDTLHGLYTEFYPNGDTLKIVNYDMGSIKLPYKYIERDGRYVLGISSRNSVIWYHKTKHDSIFWSNQVVISKEQTLKIPHIK